jgi:hypothetical protein
MTSRRTRPSSPPSPHPGLLRLLADILLQPCLRCAVHGEVLLADALQNVPGCCGLRGNGHDSTVYRRPG